MSRLFYVCPGLDQTPRGGPRRLYRHVDVLNDLGFEAYVVHARPGHRLEWFANETPVLAAPVKLRRSDVLVIPEVYREKTFTMAPGVRRVSLNLNIFNWVPPAPDGRIIEATVTNSQYAVSLLRQLDPGGPVHLVPHAVDEQIWHPDPAKKRRLITYMPRKDAALAGVAVRLVGDALASHGWELEPISGMSENGVADCLRASELFLAFGHREGFGRPPVEALACGASVVGFSGVGGTEVFESTSAHEARDGDVLALVRAVEDWVDTYDEQPDRVREQQLQDSQRILNHYTPGQERRALLEVFGGIATAPEPIESSPETDLTQEDVHPVVGARRRLRRAAHEIKQVVKGE